MVIGQNPGEVEDAKGIPFYPAAPGGGLITTIFAELGVRRSEIYWTNAVRCFHGYGNEITPASIKACKPYLLDEIEKVNPRYIVLAGNEALKAVFNHAGITKERGQLKTGPDGRQYFMILHPASALPSRYPENRKVIKRDLAFLLAHIKAAEDDTAKDDKITYRIARTNEDVDELEAELRANPKRITAFDFETNSVLTPYQLTNPVVSGIGFAWNNKSGWFLPYDHRNPPTLEWLPGWRLKVWNLIRWFLTSDVYKIAHNVKYEYNWSRGYFGVEPRSIAGCTLLLSHLLDPSKASHSLDAISWEIGMGGYKMELANWFVKNGLESDNYTLVDLEVLGKYCVKDCIATLRYFNFGYRALQKNAMLDLYNNHVRPGFYPYAHMEANGLLLDVDYFNKLGEYYKERADKLESTLREITLRAFEELPMDFNFASGDQIAGVLERWLRRDVRDIQIQLTGKKKRMSTDKRALNYLLVYQRITAPQRDFILRFRRWRTLEKLRTTYIEGVREFINADNRVRSSYNSEGTATGRRSSSHPNHQNIPREVAVKRMFIARSDHFLLGNDYINLEVRIAAAISKDPLLVKAFLSGKDIHTYAASVAYNQKYETMHKVLKADQDTIDKHKLGKAQEKFKKYRAAAKIFMWVMLFGGGPSKAAESLGISIDEAIKKFDAILGEFKLLKQMFAELEWKATDTGYAENLYGRRRPLLGLGSTDNKVRAGALREARNSPIQGCLPADTNILTPGGWVNMQNFVSGNQVWTGERWAKATKLDRGHAPRLRLHLSDGRTFDCDDRHYLLVAGKVWPEWCSVKNITGRDLIRDRCSKWGIVKGSIEDWYWAGRFLGDGCFKMKGGWSLCLGNSDRKTKNFDGLLRWLDSKHLRGRTNSTKGYSISKDDHGTISVSGGTVKGIELWKSLLVDDVTKKFDSHSKRVSCTVFTLDYPRRQSFLDGYFDSDGSERKNKRIKDYSWRDRKLTSCNKSLLEDILRLGQTLDIPGKILSKQGNSKRVWYDMRFYDPEATPTRYHPHTRVPPLTVTAIEDLGRSECMYTLSVDDDKHAFSSEGLISKNTAGDIMLEANRKVYVWLKQSNARAYMVQEVHDQLVMEVHYEDAYLVATETKRIMESVKVKVSPEMRFEVESTIGCHLGSKRSVDYGTLKNDPKTFYNICREDLLADPRQYSVQADDDIELDLAAEPEWWGANRTKGTG